MVTDCDVIIINCLNVPPRLLHRHSSGCVHTNVHDFNQDEIREKLQAFPGGSVDLLKQESGVAVLTVNNPSRMNAFSGKVTFNTVYPPDGISADFLA